MKTWLMVLLLCFAVPFQTWAAQSQCCPCPMQTNGMQANGMQAGDAAAVEAAATATASGVDVDVDLDDCCNDAESAALTGQVCKTGQACGPLAPAVAGSLALAVVNEHSTVAPVNGDVARPTGVPSPVWRPPMTR